MTDVVRALVVDPLHEKPLIRRRFQKGDAFWVGACPDNRRVRGLEAHSDVSTVSGRGDTLGRALKREISCNFISDQTGPNIAGGSFHALSIALFGHPGRGT